MAVRSSSERGALGLPAPGPRVAPPLACVGLSAVALLPAGLRLWSRRWLHRWRRRRTGSDGTPTAPALDTDGETPPTSQAPAYRNLIDQLLAQQRYALLLRPRLVASLGRDDLDRVRTVLLDAMSLVPSGEVRLEDWGDDDEEERGPASLEPNGLLVPIDALLLDRYTVTNGDYAAFVAGGGYTEMAIWEPQVWPAVLDFVDATGHPGPRYWRHGRFAPGQEHLPVVGVSFFEAAAYARWVGKRLPSEAEWVRAASWPVRVGTEGHVQRKFPWGDTMDRDRCNLWGSGPGCVSSVFDFSSGASVGGVHQMIGNVWEWTTGNFGALRTGGFDLALPSPMKSIRGGAFDTYFDVQATCQFHSGENPMSRKHNIGFRCAVSMCDLALSAGDAGGSAEDASTGDEQFCEEPISEVTR